MKGIKKYLAALCVLLPLLFASCLSLQQDIIIFSDEDEESFLLFEEQLVNLDARYYSGTEVKRVFEADINTFITDIQDQINQMGMNNAVLCRLYALQGRAYVLLGNTRKARDCYNNSVKTFKGDAESIVLASRLGLVDDLENPNVVSGCNNKPLLVLERALQAFDAKLYRQSVALFDTAFIDLDEFYKDAYWELRNVAWNLKDLDVITKNPVIIEILSSPTITTSQMLLVIQEITDFLYPYTNGKTLKENDLYNVALRNELLTSVSSPDGANEYLTKEQILTRKLCARLLWNIYSLQHGINPVKYSDVFRAMGIDSPVPDVNMNDVDFDAVLGCVEAELINLTDGINFEGNLNPSAIDVCTWIQAVE